MEQGKKGKEVDSSGKIFLKSMEKNLLKLEKGYKWGYITSIHYMQKNPFTLH